MGQDFLDKQKQMGMEHLHTKEEVMIHLYMIMVQSKNLCNSIEFDSFKP